MIAGRIERQRQALCRCEAACIVVSPADLVMCTVGDVDLAYVPPDMALKPGTCNGEASHEILDACLHMASSFNQNAAGLKLADACELMACTLGACQRWTVHCFHIIPAVAWLWMGTEKSCSTCMRMSLAVF